VNCKATLASKLTSTMSMLYGMRTIPAIYYQQCMCLQFMETRKLKLNMVQPVLTCP